MRSLSRSMRVFQIFLPYALKHLPDGSFVVLNRNYKPIGFDTTDWVEYEKYPIRYRSQLSWERFARALDVEPGGPDKDFVFFYNDQTVPISLYGAKFGPKLWAEYVRKLEKFAQLTIRTLVN